MTAALRRIEIDPGQGATPTRREPSTAVRRKPSLYLASCNPHHRRTTNTYAGQGCPNAAGAGCAGAAETATAPSLARGPRLHPVGDTIHNLVKKTQAHNITQPSGTPIPQKKTSYDWSYQYNPSGPSSVRPHAPAKITGRTYSHDRNGNQTGWTHDTNGTQRTLVWDEENRLQTLSDQGHTQQYKYDADGTRTIKRGPQGETVYVNQFYTQRPGATGSKHVYAGTSRIATKLLRQDVPGANPAGKTPYEKDLYFYHPDHLGSSSYVTDLNGRLYEHLQYFPFGESWVEQNSNVQRTPYLFTAKELDEETKLYYFGARYYDPRTSVWQSPDPIDRFKPQSPTIGLNLYQYGLLNPIRYNDPTGLNEEDKTGCDEVCQIVSERQRTFVQPLATGAQTVAEGASKTGDALQTGYEVYATGGPIKVGIAAVTTRGRGLLQWFRNLFGRSKAESTVTKEGAESAVNAIRLRNQLASQEIASGHAFKKHVIERGEFKGIAATQEQFAAHIESVMNNPTAVRQLSGGRTAFWHGPTQTVVIRNPAAVDGGTAFQPTLGRTYFDEILK